MILITDCVNLLSLRGLHQGSGSAYRHKATFSPTCR